MARLEINRSGEMEVFVRVVERSGFSAAARSLRMTPSAVSKLVARLEARLGARLVHRSTRRLQLTPEGIAFFERAKRILAEIDDAEREASSGAAPRGRVRVNSNVPFGLHHLLPLVPGFLERYPEVRLDIVLTDQVIDLFEERADVAIRVGPLRTSQLVARKLGSSRMVVVGAPHYLAHHGTPRTLAELETHNRIGFNFARSFDEWPFVEGGVNRTLPAVGNTLSGDGETSRRLALAGVGLARLAWFHIGPDIAAGRLVPVLEEFNPGDSEDIHAVFVGQGGRLPARVRAFIDYLAETVTLPKR
ncbi:LysR family transcriptional regulator [Microvirga rosea]|uniref:LysR family transcriptional regulator n=1 Tax=Microvirga rosea TaxID=2715425 RepID=UPI001D0B1779|nr:LysR family transcriptional regulator [Microvirga rosea]MCB8819172.1 LysR family transcriptional regulator [Microvirga rosea]